MWLEQSLKNANTKESTSDIFIQWLCTSKAPTKTQVEHGYHMLSMLLLRFCALSNKITLATLSPNLATAGSQANYKKVGLIADLLHGN